MSLDTERLIKLLRNIKQRSAVTLANLTLPPYLYEEKIEAFERALHELARAREVRYSAEVAES